MSDQIKFILNTSAQYLAMQTLRTAQAQEAHPLGIDSEQAAYDFLNNSDLSVLAAIVEVTSSATTRLRFVYEVPADRDGLLFYKIPQIGGRDGEHADAAAMQIGMLTLEGGLGKTIYSCVTRVYAPRVAKRADYSPEVEQILDSLQCSLGSTLGFPKSGVQTIQDEISFWSQLVQGSPVKADRDKAKVFITALEELKQHVRYLESTRTLSELSEFVDTVHGSMDDLWRLPGNYPQNRMKDLIDILGSYVVDSCANYLREQNLFTLGAPQVNDMIVETTEQLQSWLRVCDSLTRLFWPNNGQHMWIGEPHVPQLADRVVGRLAEMSAMRSMFQQIVTVFYGDAEALHSLNGIFEQFKDINVFDVNPFGTKRWSQISVRLETQLQPIDERIASLVRVKLQPHANNARQIVHMFTQNAAILKRPAVMKLLSSEQEKFAGAMLVLVKEMRDRLSEGAFPTDAALNLSTVCSECQWLKMYEQQINEVEQTGALLEGHAQHEAITRSLADIKAEVGKLLAANMESWRDESLAAVQSGDLTLQTDKCVVEFESSGRNLMQVSFNPKLVTFCQDVRQLETLGMRIPLELRDTCTKATTFMASAKRLQQIANFHNTIGDRMIVCLRPIMLSNAIELSRLVRSESVTWNDRESVDRYVEMLQVSVKQLDKDNTYLSAQHEAMRTIICRLMSVDLLRQAQVWKDELRRLRDVLAELEAKGYQNLNAFKLHWDHQLYKVLELQYVSVLTDLSNKLPDIHVDLLFREQELQFRPPIEEIRLTYFEHLRKFLERPLTFRGLSEQGSRLFPQMIARNRSHFDVLYARSEDAFAELLQVQTVWRPWVALGQANLDNLCAVHLRTWEDWDRNFKSCKHFSQQIAKIQMTELTTGCFVVNVAPLRADIEHIGRRYWETLALTLRMSILTDIEQLHMFVQTGLQVLQNVPFDESGIAEAGAKYERIMLELPAMRDLLKAVELKDTCLAGWCKERVSTLAHLVTQWDQLQPLIENHSVVLQKQIDRMRDHIVSQMVAWRDQADKFEIRWEATIEELRNGDQHHDMQLFRERQLGWQELAQKCDRMQADCVKYNIEFDGAVADTFARIDGRVTADSAEWLELEEFFADLAVVTSEEWTVYRRRPYMLTDFLTKWNKAMVGSITTAAKRIRQQLESYQQVVPVLQTMHADGLTDRHWSRFFKLVLTEDGGTVTPPAMYQDIQLQHVLLNVDALLRNTSEIQALVREAASEQVIRQAMSELDQWGATAVLCTFGHRDSRGETVALGRDFQEVLNKIGDNQSLLQSAKNSSSIDTFSDQATIWETRLSTLDTVLTSLNQIQRKWIYLEPIFNNGTMKSDGNAFQRIDKDFRYIMKHINDDNRLLSIVKINNIPIIIESLESQLTRCQSALKSFITLKRNAFPRFYFLADDDLLEILGQSSNIDVIQKHIGKLIPGIQSIGTNNAGLITNVQSADGDSVVLKNPVEPLAGTVELWLGQLVTELGNVLRELTGRCSRLDSFQLDDIHAYPAQVLSTAKALSFTRLTEKAIQSMGLPAHLKRLNDEVELYNSDEYRGGGTSANVDEDKSASQQAKIRSLLIDLVHYVDIVQMLIDQNCTRLTDWCWLQQLKFYRDAQTERVTVRMVYAEFTYAYEYLGTPNKLVHTALTHNCYMTLTQAMHMGLGGNPFGPAGTGKTECVKALGGMLGRLVLVFNCSENVDTDAMALILTGLARCGAWGCFDEFNRLPSATLADITALIQPLQLAIKAQQTTVQLPLSTDTADNRNTNTAIGDNRNDVPLDLSCGIFVTLNPAGEAYGGRQQLPNALQSLFRPVVMQRPAPTDIAGVLLFTERFRHARQLGARLVEVFRMCEQMLSAQRHYDWGLRELRTVLMACGKLRADADAVDFAAESRLVMQALRSNTMSKLSARDCGIFDLLLNCVFANVDGGPTETSAGSLRQHVTEAFAELGLTLNEPQVEKCMQLYEQLTKRMGVVVFGPPMSGKSTVIAVLKQALSKRAGIIRTYTIAPKSMTRVQLLGCLDPDTRQWRDGVLTNTAVVVNAEPLNVSSWIICDGDVDPEWIEALNSVLDDNRLLTLPSGWRIQFGSNVHFLFETHDLRHASPATISRMGIVSLSADHLQANTVLDAWLHRQHLEAGNPIENLVDSYLQPALDWLTDKSQSPAANGMAVGRHTRLNLLHNCLPFVEKAMELQAQLSKDVFVVAMLRGLGSALQPEHLRAFCAHVLELSDTYVPQQSEPELTYYNAFRRTLDVYTTTITSADVGDDGGALVRTGHICVYEDVLRGFIQCDRRPAFVLIGPAGCGKTTVLRHVVAEFSGFQLVTVSCSGQLTAGNLQQLLRAHCLTVSAVRGREYRPRHQRLIVYLKNVHLCAVDAWGTCAVTELLLQIVQRGGFYATDTLEWITVCGLQVCASMTAGGAEASNVSQRFLSAVRVLAMSAPTEVEMHAIFGQQMERVVRHFKDGRERSAEAVECLLDFYYQLSKSLTRAQQAHYVFSPKMLSAFVVGLSNYPPECLAEVFHHELICSFRNRLISDEHRATFDSILAGSARNMLPSNDDLFFVPNAGQTIPYKDRSLIALDSNDWRTIVEKTITVCCSESLRIRCPLDDRMLRNVSHIARVLSRQQQTCHLVMCGPSGSGRREALHVACTYLGVRMFSAVPAARYNMDSYYNDLKAAAQVAALDGQSVVFHLDHAWLSYLPALMRPLEAILLGSEMAELFGDDLESVASGLRSVAQADGYQDSLTAYFWMRFRCNFHLVLSLNTDAQLSDLFQHYPCLYQNAEMLYASMPSSSSAVDQTTYTSDLVALTVSSNNLNSYEIPSLPAIPAHILGDWSESPLRYQQFVGSYAQLYHSAAGRLHDQMRTLRSGVTKLSAANEVVDQLQQQAQAQELQLADKKRLAQQSLDMIATTMRSANVQRTNLLELRQQAEASGERLLERKAAIEEELREVEPILREASAAVGQIRGEALSEIRSLRAPPDVIRDILEGVLRLMGVRDTSWNSMKSFLAKRGVKEDIRGLDPVRITPENCKAVEKLLATKADSFLEKNAKRASAAAAPLAVWVIANVKYARVMQSIKPLEREQAQLELNLEQSEGEMRSLTSGLDDVDGRVQELSGQLNLYTQEAAMLEIKLNDARQTLGSAQDLVSKLGAEYSNWQKQLSELEQEQAHLGSHTYLIGLAVTHFSHNTFELRSELMEKTQEYLEVPEFDLTKSIVSDQDQIIWESIGLTSDVQAIENAAVITKMLQLPFGSAPIPLLLDPSGNAFAWLLEYHKLHSRLIDVCSQTHDRFTHTLELAVRFGKCLIVPDFDAVRPPLLALLDAQLPVRFNKPMLPVGAKLVDLHADFRLILVTRSATPPHRLTTGPHRAHVTCMPFTATVTGYTEQLMTQTVQLRQPTLEAQRRRLLHDEGQLLSERSRLQRQLLLALSDAEGDILRNETLLATLNAVKLSSDSIEASLGESHRVRVQLMQQYNAYREYCQEAARFFIAIAAVYGQLSVTLFTELFMQSVEQLDEHTDLSQLARLTFGEIARTTQRSDHIQLGLQICRAAFPFQVMDTEWESFITNFMTDDDGGGTAKSSAADATTADDVPAWLQPAQMAKMRALHRNHPTLYAQLAIRPNSQSTWNAFALTRQSDEVPAACSEFQKLLVTQCLRPDLLLACAARIVGRLLGLKSSLAAIGATTVQQLADETTPTTTTTPTPHTRRRYAILLLTSIASGSDVVDPTRDVHELAVSTVGAARYVEHSVGRGHDRQALDVVRTASRQRQWCCLNNVHNLADDSLAALADLLQAMTTTPSADGEQQRAMDGFKLWLIADAALQANLPAQLAHQCSAVLCEPPTGVKLLLLHQLQRAQPAVARVRDARSVKLRVLVHILHTVLLERRRYVPSGWTRWYDFGAADGRTAQLIVDWLEQAATTSTATTSANIRGGNVRNVSSGRIDWVVLRGLCERLAYGGRISGDQDTQVLRAHLDMFLDERALSADGWRPLQMQRYAVPMSANISDHMAAVAAALPDAERPEMLGLGAATNAQRNLVASALLLKRLRSVHLARGVETANATASVTMASYAKRLRPVLGLWKKLNSNAPAIAAIPTTDDPSDTIPSTPWQSFVHTEHQLARTLIAHIHNQLIALNTAVKQQTLSAQSAHNESDLLKHLHWIADNQVPVDWRALWPNGPRVCTEFMCAVRSRATAAQLRMQNVSSGGRFDDEQRLGDVFNLAAYLAALKLTNAVELNVSPCDLVLCSTLRAITVSTGGEQMPDTRPNIVGGLAIDGATFRGNRVILSSASDINSRDNRNAADATPSFRLYFVVDPKPRHRIDATTSSSTASVQLPMYANASREQLVCVLDVETDAAADAIVLAGVALVVSTDA